MRTGAKVWTGTCATSTPRSSGPPPGPTWSKARIAGTRACGRYLAPIEAEFDDLRVEPQKLIDAGEQVVSSVRISGWGKTSGAPVALTLISVGKLRDGMVYRLRNYPDMAAALEAAGLTE
jgi:ketosteroid isomerase-like protein